VQQANEGIQKWNEPNPHLPAKPPHTGPYVPQLQPTGVDLSDRIADFGACQARQLPISELVDLLTKLGKEKGFGNESFRPLYLIYRVLTAIGMHPTLNILGAYFVPGGSFASPRSCERIDHRHRPDHRAAQHGLPRLRGVRRTRMPGAGRRGTPRPVRPRPRPAVPLGRRAHSRPGQTTRLSREWLPAAGIRPAFRQHVAHHHGEFFPRAVLHRQEVSGRDVGRKRHV
jgi:hypothetical protein